ncbi:thiolase family protein [Frankia sp. AgB1.9]|uniref:thiolase family protein n=1 Tax=unclassified Frankia TaxID=2632575 RepID=UPI0019332D53|nr:MULTISPECIES: thiolase family protein [unclassified Frankia]MBL7491426.1 thiolase family protein [Frankia sp. AgW1.1]MBL7553775.1 thiolase family protein [Frankia sp. AgB1.9]MBL7620964.1 thiolase family protein [Frankia sp. AgB1.8]
MGPSRRATIVGLHNTRQARSLDGETPRSLVVAAARGALADAGLTLADVDGVCAGAESAALVYDLRLGPAWQGRQFGLAMVAEAAAAVATGQAELVLVAAAAAGVYTDRAATAPWTRPENEFVAPFGLFTAAEFALIARRHMHLYGTTPEQLATVAATIRTNGHLHPGAVYHGRGPFAAADILASRMVADPFHLLDCSTTSEGGCALVVTTAERARDLPHPPVHVLGAGMDVFGPAYRNPPVWDLTGRRPGHLPVGLVGARAADRAFATAGLARADVDVAELYDPFSFEIIRQLEAFGFCKPGEGGPFAAEGHVGPGGTLPVTTDGGTMAFSHPGADPQMLQRAIRAAEQVRGDCASRQVTGARVALCSAGGAGALFSMVMLLGAADAAG